MTKVTKQKPCKKRRKYSTAVFSLEVVGLLWQGNRCKHIYGLPGNHRPATMEDAKDIAVDFATLDSARIIEIYQEVTEIVVITKLNDKDKSKKD